MLLRALYLGLLGAWCGAVLVIVNVAAPPDPYDVSGGGAQSAITTADGVRQSRRDVAFSEFFAQHILTSLPVADTLSFPLRPPDGEGVFIAGQFREYGNSGEDWNTAKGDGDIGQPVYSIADGWVTLAQNFEAAWGNTVIVTSRLPAATAAGTGPPAAVDVMYTHLDTLSVKPLDMVKRGQKLGTIGNAGGLYKAHLHWEIRRVVGLGLASGFDPMADDPIWLNPTQTVLRFRGEGAAPPKMRRVPPTERHEWGTTASGTTP